MPRTCAQRALLLLSDFSRQVSLTSILVSADCRIAEAAKDGYGEMYETPLFDEITGRPLNDKARRLVGEKPTGEQSGYSGVRRR